MSMTKYNRSDCFELLCKKQEYLNSKGLSRYPQRSDFTNDEVIAIKAFLGPWPRALEAAGLKPPRDDGKLERQIEKRIRSKRRKTDFKKQKNNENHLRDLLAEIQTLDINAAKLAREYQATLAKPPGSLGQLEEIAIKLAGITGKLHNNINKKQLLVFASDNGVCVENVASAPQSVTLAQTVNLTRGKTGAATLAKHFGCTLTVIDAGVATDIHEPAVINRKIAYGTNNIACGAAMTREQAVKALLMGFEAARTAAKDADILGIGEMGIGNTTTSSAVLAALTGSPVEKVTGRGGGITDESYLHKLEVIKQALEVNNPDASDPIDVITKVGGFDIAAMAGAFLGAAHEHIPVVIDGFISAVAALAAYRLCESAKDYFIASHSSFEIGYGVAINELQLTPMLTLGMRLGEGSGCPLAFEIVSAACAIMNNMATFEDAGIDDSYLDSIRCGDNFTVGDNT